MFLIVFLVGDFIILTFLSDSIYFFYLVLGWQLGFICTAISVVGSKSALVTRRLRAEINALRVADASVSLPGWHAAAWHDCQLISPGHTAVFPFL